MENLISYISSILLRYMRQGRSLPSSEHFKPNVKTADLDYLRLHWAVSRPIDTLCHYIIEHRFELQAGTEYHFLTDDVNIKGQLDARKTALIRAVTGHPTIVSYRSTRKSFATGPNQVLAWVLVFASRYAVKWSDNLSTSKPDSIEDDDPRNNIRQTAFLLAEVRRISLVREAIGIDPSPVRPTPQALQQAKTSRKRVYQLAYEAYINLSALEHGEEQATRDLLIETLIQPKEDYQILELALAFCLAESFKDILKLPVQLNEITPGGNNILLSVGSYSITWQGKTDSYKKPVQEPSEIILAEILKLFNLRESNDRPHISVRFGPDKKVVAVGEAKSFSNRLDAWRNPLREALAQIIRYSRGYRQVDDIRGLISQSCICLSYYPHASRVIPPPPLAPVALDIEDILLGRINEWRDRIISGS